MVDADAIAPLRERLTPLIDEAVARLSSTDRAGVLLSFFDNKTYREVGETMGVSEEAVAGARESGDRQDAVVLRLARCNGR